MKITIICSSRNHPVYDYLLKWRRNNKKYYSIEVVTSVDSAKGGEFLFLISCNEIIGKEVRDKYRFTLVIHASNPPRGRGWSPLVWQILEGENKIAVTLMEAEDRVDTGLIWGQKMIEFEGHELYDEINEALFFAEIDLMNYAVKQYKQIKPYKQPDIPPTYYRKRTPKDSEIDATNSIVENFNILRVSDPTRYPAFFSHLNIKYKIKIEKLE